VVDRVGINWVCGAAPGLDLLSEALCVWGRENTDFGSVAEGIRQVVQKSSDGLCDTDGCKNAGAKEGVAAETIIERVLRAWDIRMYP
jgi:hypothetical protein